MKEARPLSSTLFSLLGNMAKSPQKLANIMMIVTVITGFAALAVAVVGVAKEEYIIAVAMILVAAWQVINYKKWKKLKK